MTQIETNMALYSLMSLAVLWWLLAWKYRELCVDGFRQRMFALRDALFDAAADGLIDFEQPAYRTLRSMMNGYIRFGHRFNWFSILIFVLLNRSDPYRKREAKALQKNWDESLSGLNTTTQESMETYFRKVHYLVLQHLIVSSPIILITVVLPLLFFGLAMYSVERVVAFFRKPLEQIDIAAMAYGQ